MAILLTALATLYILDLFFQLKRYSMANKWTSGLIRVALSPGCPCVS